MECYGRVCLVDCCVRLGLIGFSLGCGILVAGSVLVGFDAPLVLGMCGRQCSSSVGAVMALPIEMRSYCKDIRFDNLDPTLECLVEGYISLLTQEHN